MSLKYSSTTADYLVWSEFDKMVMQFIFVLAMVFLVALLNMLL